MGPDMGFLLGHFQASSPSEQLRKLRPQINGHEKGVHRAGFRQKKSLEKRLLVSLCSQIVMLSKVSLPHIQGPHTLSGKKPRGSHPQSLSGQQLPAGQGDPTLPPAARHSARPDAH